MDLIAKIVYATATIAIVWLTLCGTIVIATDGTAGITDVANGTVAVLNAVVEAASQLLPGGLPQTRP